MSEADSDYEKGRRNAIRTVLQCWHYVRANASWPDTVPEELRPMFQELTKAVRLADAVRAITTNGGDA